MTTLVNLVTNPSAETNTTGYSALAGGGVAAITNPTDGGYAGSRYARATWSTSATGAGGGVKYGDVAVVAGHTYSFSGYVGPSITNRLQISVEWRTASATISTVLGTQTVVNGSTTAGDWSQAKRLTLEGQVAPATATVARISFISVTGTSYALWLNTNYLDVDGVMAVEAAGSVAYGDPSTSAAWAWTGTAHASTSTYYEGSYTFTQHTTGLPYVEVLIQDIAPTISTITLHRLTGTRDFTVRGVVSRAISGSITVIDPEIPFNVACVYKAEMFDVNGVSVGYTPVTGTTTLTTTDTWVHNPLDFTSGVKVDLLETTGQVISHPVDGTVVTPLGRSVGVIVSNGRRGLTGFNLVVSTSTQADADKFTLLVGDYNKSTVPVVCVRSGTPLRIPKPLFLAVLDPKEIAVNVQMGGNLIDWDITGDEVASPAPGVIIPLLTRADLNSYFATRTALNAGGSTRLDLDRRYDLAGFAP